MKTGASGRRRGPSPSSASKAIISKPAKPSRSILASDVDVVLMRQDPPFDIGYITATYLLERIAGETLVVNDPRSVRDAPEKLFVLDFARFMPPTMISRSLADVRAFHARHGEIVVKPLHGKAGEGVFRIGADGTNLTALAELFGSIWKEPFIVQAFLPAVAEGDKRIVLVDGEVAGCDQPDTEQRRIPIEPRGGRDGTRPPS